eukprot:g2210.t1
MAADLTDEQQALKHRFDDFDAEYGLGGGKARSILDWERRALNMVAKEYGEEVVRIRYINENGFDKDAEDDFDRSPGYEMDADGKPDCTSLKEHLFKHQGVRPYKCEHPGCTKAFDSMSNFNRHVRLHQKNEAAGNSLVDVHMEGGSSKKQRTMTMAHEQLPMPMSVPMLPLPVPMPASMHLNTAHLLRTIKPEPTNPQLSQLSPKSQLLAQAQALTPPPTQGAGVFSSSLSSSSADGSSRACMKLSPSCSPQPSFGTATAGGISSSISNFNSSSSSSSMENIHPNTGTIAGTSSTSSSYGGSSSSSSGLGALGALLPVVPMERQVSIDFNALGIDLVGIDMGIGIGMGGVGIGSMGGGCGGGGNLSIGDAYLSSLSSELDEMASAAAAAAEKEKENPGPATIAAGAPAAAQAAALCG